MCSAHHVTLTVALVDCVGSVAVQLQALCWRWFEGGSTLQQLLSVEQLFGDDTAAAAAATDGSSGEGTGQGPLVSRHTGAVLVPLAVAQDMDAVGQLAAVCGQPVSHHTAVLCSAVGGWSDVVGGSRDESWWLTLCTLAQVLEMLSRFKQHLRV